MRFWKKFSPIIGLIVLLGVIAGEANAAGIQVRNAELSEAGEAYQLNADFDISFSLEVEDALNKGIPLNFLLEFQLVSPRRFWFDQEIINVKQNLRLSYHALSRQYLINLSQQQKSFTSLAEALEELSRVRNWIVLEKSQVGKGEDYRAELSFQLDSSRLPKALQVEALGSERWNLAAKPYRWTPTFKSE